MKNILLAFLLFVPAFSFAHEEKPDSTQKKECKNEFGLDMIYFLNLFRQQFEQANENTMVFAFDHHLKKERIIRFFLSTGFSSYKTKQDTGNAIYNKQTEIIALPGFGWEKHISHHWAYFYGLQAKVQNEYSSDLRGDNNNVGVQKTYSNNWFYGPSGFAGIKFVINSRISIQTEMDIAFIFHNEKTGFTNEKFPSQNNSTTVTGYNTEYIIPKTILLNFMF